MSYYQRNVKAESSGQPDKLPSISPSPLNHQVNIPSLRQLAQNTDSFPQQIDLVDRLSNHQQHPQVLRPIFNPSYRPHWHHEIRNVIFDPSLDMDPTVQELAFEFFIRHFQIYPLIKPQNLVNSRSMMNDSTIKGMIFGVALLTLVIRKDLNYIHHYVANVKLETFKALDSFTGYDWDLAICNFSILHFVQETLNTIHKRK